MARAPSKVLAGRAGLAGVLALVSMLAVESQAAQLSSSVFFKLQRGMNEGELLVRAGQPDLVTYPGVTARETSIGDTVTDEDGNEAFVRFRRTRIPEIKQYHYIPDRSEHDPFLTVVTLQGGLISRIERTKVFSRENLPEPARRASAPTVPVRSDAEVKRDRAERTFKAAQDYAATRQRLLDRNGEYVAPERDPTLYRRVEGDGSVYYGDRPSGELPLTEAR